MSTGTSYNARPKHGETVKCLCKEPARISTANTPLNRGKKFYGCRNWNREDGGCKFFKWVDERTIVGNGDQSEVDIESLVAFNNTLLAENRELRIQIADEIPSHAHQMQQLREKLRQQKGKLLTYKEQLEKSRATDVYKIVAFFLFSLVVAVKFGVWNL